jgi:hypothetical protein
MLFFNKFKPIHYQRDTFIINNTIHKLYIPTNEDPNHQLFYNETSVLHTILTDYYLQEKQITSAIREDLTSFVDEILSNWSATSIPSRLDEFLKLLESTYDDDSPKRLQEVISYIHTTIDIRVIDVYIGRFYRHLYEAYFIPYKGLLEEDEKNILDTYECVPWIWVIPQFQQVNQKHMLNIPITMKGNNHQQNAIL